MAAQKAFPSPSMKSFLLTEKWALGPVNRFDASIRSSFIEESKRANMRSWLAETIVRAARERGMTLDKPENLEWSREFPAPFLRSAVKSCL